MSRGTYTVLIQCLFGVKSYFSSKFEQNLEKRVFCLYIGRFFYSYRYLNESCGRDLDFNAHWLLWSFSVSYSLLTFFKLVSSMVWGKKPHSPPSGGLAACARVGHRTIISLAPPLFLDFGAPSRDQLFPSIKSTQ